MSERTLMPSLSAMISPSDVSASIHDMPRYAKRFSVDVAEEALANMVPQVIQHVAERLGERVVYEHQEAIHAAVHGYLFDRAWAEPLIREAIREAVRAVIRDMLDGGGQP